MSIPEPGDRHPCHCPICEEQDPTCDWCGALLGYDSTAGEWYCPTCDEETA